MVLKLPRRKVLDRGCIVRWPTQTGAMNVLLSLDPDMAALISHSYALKYLNGINILHTACCSPLGVVRVIGQTWFSLKGLITSQSAFVTDDLPPNIDVILGNLQSPGCVRSIMSRDETLNELYVEVMAGTSMILHGVLYSPNQPPPSLEMLNQVVPRI